MINIQLHNDCPATDTIVPNQFIDRFMPSANGEFVKVYLYLLRCIHSHASNCTISEIADKFNNTEMDIQRALRYWQKEGLLSLEETADGTIVRNRSSSVSRRFHRHGRGIFLSACPVCCFFGRNTSIRCRGKRFWLPACESAAGTADPPLYAG